MARVNDRHRQRLKTLRRRLRHLDDRILPDGPGSEYDRSERAALRYVLAVISELDENWQTITPAIYAGAVDRLRADPIEEGEPDVTHA